MTMRGKNKGAIALLVISVVIGALAAWLWAGNISASQREDRGDLDLFLDASSAGWAEVTSQFFTVPEVAAETIGALSPQMDATEDKLNLLLEAIRLPANLDAAYIGYPDGSFLFVGRSDEVVPNGFRTRVITVDDGQRIVELSWTDESFREVRAEVDDQDVYDPTARPWFEPIARGAERHWTAPYVFASSQQPGITHSIAVRDEAGDLAAVVGIDLRLTEVNDFLERLSPGPNGAALVVDDNGQVIAESSMETDSLAVAVEDGALALDQSPELRALVERLEADPSGTIQGRSGDGRSTTIVRPAGARDEWYLAVRARDEDFLNDATATDVFGIFAVGVTAAAIAAALGYLALRYLIGLKRQAEIDELTGIYNRRGVKRQLDDVLARANTPVHVAIIDLDDFKWINDSHGHAAGDAILAEMGVRLREFCISSGTMVGRLGGDEFVVFGDGALPNWALLNTNLAQGVPFDDGFLSVTASIGVATAVTSGSEVEDYFRAADRLLFQAKRRGGNTFQQSAPQPSAPQAGAQIS